MVKDGSGIEAFSYADGHVPKGYTCTGCGAVGVKLWRQYQTLACCVELLCAPCALADQDKHGEGDDEAWTRRAGGHWTRARSTGRCRRRASRYPSKRLVDADGRRQSRYGKTDQIGWLIPAVPVEEGGTYWGYTSVPEPGVKWWRSVPTTRSDIDQVSINRADGHPAEPASRPPAKARH